MISFEYEGKEYNLTFTAASIAKMEDNGFDFSELEKKSMSAPFELFCGMFIENHADESKKQIQKLWNALTNEDESGKSLIEAIGEELSEAVTNITVRKGNVKWRRS